MLKIKEDKIQELEKLGFKYFNDPFSQPCYYYPIYSNSGEYIEIVIETNRVITICSNCEETWADELDILYELLANDMVEKVDK